MVSFSYKYLKEKKHTLGIVKIQTVNLVGILKKMKRKGDFLLDLLKRESYLNLLENLIIHIPEKLNGG